MATTSILICCGLLTFASKAFTAPDKPNDAVLVFGMGSSSDEFKLDCKCAALLLAFLSVFLCQSLSVICLTQVNILINLLATDSPPASKEHVTVLLGKGIFLCTVGNRVFFSALPLMMWIFGPILVFACSIGMVAVLYSVDVVSSGKSASQLKEAEVTEDYIV